MGHLANAFKREMESPTILVKNAGLWSNFATATRAAGPALAVGSTVPDLMGAYQSHKSDKEIEEETPDYDEQGQPIDPEKKRHMKQRAREASSGAVGEGIGSAVGSLAGWLIPGGPMLQIPGMLATSWLGRKAGRAVGEATA